MPPRRKTSGMSDECCGFIVRFQFEKTKQSHEKISHTENLLTTLVGRIQKEWYFLRLGQHHAAADVGDGGGCCGGSAAGVDVGTRDHEYLDCPHCSLDYLERYVAGKTEEALV